MTLDPAAIRAEIPVVAKMVYLTTGWSGPSPAYVIEAIEERLRLENYGGPTSPEVLESGSQIRESSKRAVARLYGAAPEEILLTENTTEGVNVVVNGLSFGPGDQVVICDLEHPSVLLPAYSLKATRGVEVKIVSPAPNASSAEVAALYGEAIGPRTRLVMLSHVQYSSGLRMPVAEIAAMAHEAGARVLVDGAQGPGHVALDMDGLGADFYSSPGQKWLLGPDQTGALFVRRELIAELRPARVGFGFAESFDQAGGFQERADDIEKFTVSTTSVPLRAGYLAAVERVLDLGMEAIEDRQLALAARLKARLSATPGVRVLSPLEGPGCSGLTTFAVEGLPAPDVAASLWDTGEKILVRSISYPSAVRASTSFFNTEEEVDVLADAVRALSAKA